MKKILTLLLFVAVISAGGFVYWKSRPKPELTSKFVQPVRNEIITEQSQSPVLGEETVNLAIPAEYVKLNNPYHVFQTFNNCGPATLAMALNFWGVNKTQEELGKLMRPYQNIQGDNDDKTIFTSEFVRWAEEYKLMALSRPNGDIELIKKLTANGIPVVVKTWLHPGEDIGHFRLVLGYDDNAQAIWQDDSYEGKNKKISYWDFLNMWQAFNYNYVVVYPSHKAEIVKAILGEEWIEQKSWENALTRASKEEDLDSTNPYPLFNQTTAYYHIGQYEKSVEMFEKVKARLPRRMLWYQIEPIQAYQNLNNYDQVFEISNNILENGNRAFSELYLIRAQIYKSQGNEVAANQELDLARKYNENLLITN